jgi:predicted MPP superfamily phosphohydrolase
MSVLSSFLRQHAWLCLLIICLVSQYFYVRMWLERLRTRKSKAVVAICFAVMNLAWFYALRRLFTDGMMDDSWTYVGRPALSWQLVHLLALLPVAIMMIAADVVTKLVKAIGKRRGVSAPANASRRVFLKTVGTLGLTGLAVTAGGGVLAQTLAPAMRSRTLLCPNLPSALDGLVVAHLTDFHLGRWMNPLELRRAFELTKERKPDVVFLTGDLVDANPDFAGLYHEPLRLLSETPHGVYAVLGNHDHYAGPERVTKLLNGRGLTMLVDRRVRIEGLPMTVVGLDDQGQNMFGFGTEITADDDPDTLDFSRVSGPEPRDGDFMVLLNHRPEGYRQANAAGFNLYLAGHTHGGQYQLPGSSQLNFAALFYKYSSGLYHDWPAWLNVSRGLAAVGVPFRLFAWPEIDLFELKRS